jgi:hypothetical protein
MVTLHILNGRQWPVPSYPTFCVPAFELRSNTGREAKYRRSMAPRSRESTAGAATMLHMIESASLAAMYEAQQQQQSGSTTIMNGRVVGGAPGSRGVMTSSTDLTAANLAAAAGGGGAPRNPYGGPNSRYSTNGGLRSRNSLGGGRAVLGSGAG